MRLSSLQSANYQSRQRELDAQLFHFCVVIDLAQSENGNPSVLPEIELTYAMALRKLPVVGTDLLRRGCDEAFVMGVAAATALAAGHRALARAYFDFEHKPARRAHRPSVLIENYSDDRPFPGVLDADYRAIRTDRHKLIHWIQHPEFDELYDFSTDTRRQSARRSLHAVVRRRRAPRTVGLC